MFSPSSSIFPMASAGSHWCYSCSRFVLISDSISCPDCDGGFLEHVHQSSDSFHHRRQHHSPTRFPPPPPPTTITPPTSNRSPNPVIVLRGSNNPSDQSPFEMYYDDGSDSGLRPLPPSMTEFLLGSGFDRLLDQISQIELTNNSSCDHPPASKSAIEALPVIEIAPSHLESDSQSHCAVCKETFLLSSEAREMPCKHIYHPDCILPWLAIRNSCPVCRRELPAEEDGDDDVATATTVAGREGEEEGESSAGMTIWRLPGGGFAVGRIPGGWRGGMPVVYTEVDGGRLGEERRPRRVAWGSRRGGSGGERSGGFAGRIMRIFGCFGGSSGSGSGSRSQVDRRSRSSFTLFRTASSSSSSSRRRHWLAS